MARGLEQDSKLITVRRNRVHYGTPVSHEFSPLRHREADAYIDEHDGEKYASGQMEWLANKGDALIAGQSHHATIDLYRNFDEDESRVFTVALAACQDDVAPRRFKENSTTLQNEGQRSMKGFEANL